MLSIVPRAILRLLPALSLLALAACFSVKPVVLDRKTQLENQILGSFQRLEQDLILASSVRGAPPTPQKKLSPLQREALEALMLREYNRDDIEDLKGQQVLGEGNDGMLKLVATPTDAATARRARRLVQEENHARQVIIKRVIQLGRDLSDKDRPLVRRILYRLNVQTARPGDLVQGPDGQFRALSARSQ
jgi:hypothetical protein